MIIRLSGIAARESGKTEFEYNGKMTKKELLSNIHRLFPKLGNMKLEIAINSERVQSEDIALTKKDDILVFNAFAGG